MHHSPIRLLVLEMQEPVLAILRMHPTTLMRAVDVGLALSQHDLMLIGAIRTLRAHSQLEPRRHTTSRTHNPVPSIALIELRPFASSVLSTIAIKHNHRLANGLRTICR